MTPRTPPETIRRLIVPRLNDEKDNLLFAVGDGRVIKNAEETITELQAALDWVNERDPQKQAKRDAA